MIGERIDLLNITAKNVALTYTWNMQQLFAVIVLIQLTGVKLEISIFLFSFFYFEFVNLIHLFLDKYFDKY